MARIITKMDALEVWREQVLPRVVEKYEQDLKRDYLKRRTSWNSFVDMLEFRKFISSETKVLWKTHSLWTSIQFVNLLHKEV